MATPDKLPQPLETRTVTTSFELRNGDSTAPVLEGYASTFGQEYDLGPFREVIEHGAFQRTLTSMPDVRLLIDHDGQPLARTKSGTLALAEDTTGLHVRSELDASDPDVQRLLPKMRRGDLDQMSFAFRVPVGGDSWSDDYGLRSIREVNLTGGDVSVVTYPANPGTSVSLRSRDARDAMAVFVQTITSEMRAGQAVSAANLSRLHHVLDQLANADDALDAAEASLSEVLGVTNPDAADDATRAGARQEPAEAPGRPLAAIHQALALLDL